MTPNPIKCPGCGQTVQFVFNPEGQDFCPQCGSPPPAAPASARFHWLLFIAVLLAPAVFALLGALGRIDGLAVGSPLIGGGLAGLLCGIHLARHVGQTSAARLWLGILFVGVFACVSGTLSFFGCLLGGFQLNMH